MGDNDRPRIRSPARYVPLHDQLGTGNSPETENLSRDESANYRGLEYDGYSSGSGPFQYCSPPGLRRYDYRLPYGGGRESTYTSPDGTLEREMAGLNLYNPWRRRQSNSAPLRSYHRSSSPPRSRSHRYASGDPIDSPSPEDVLGIPPRPMTVTLPEPDVDAGNSSLKGGISSLSSRVGYQVPQRSATPSIEMQELELERRPHPLDMLAGPRRSHSSSSLLPGMIVGVEMRGDRGRIRRQRPIGDIADDDDEERSLTPNFADAYRAEADREGSQSTHSRREEERRQRCYVAAPT
ncbi:hypothetical protein R1flu_010499 [Riccia fluitans]|uniref:Uncharacterized protein n=1 Tax=Riccia fluitans TaxID=41844 RepID=A0ABD1Z555_9MARC